MTTWKMWGVQNHVREVGRQKIAPGFPFPKPTRRYIVASVPSSDLSSHPARIAAQQSTLILLFNSRTPCPRRRSVDIDIGKALSGLFSTSNSNVHFPPGRLRHHAAIAAALSGLNDRPSWALFVPHNLDSSTANLDGAE
jgi:hypothetical protein